MSSQQMPGERFSRPRFGRGYDVESVDDFLGRAELGAVTATDIRQMTFSTVYRGYDETAVDNALDAFIGRLTRDGLGGSAAAQPETLPRSWLSRLFGNR